MKVVKLKDVHSILEDFFSPELVNELKQGRILDATFDLPATLECICSLGNDTAPLNEEGWPPDESPTRDELMLSLTNQLAEETKLRKDLESQLRNTKRELTARVEQLKDEMVNTNDALHENGRLEKLLQVTEEEISALKDELEQKNGEPTKANSRLFAAELRIRELEEQLAKEQAYSSKLEPQLLVNQLERYSESFTVAEVIADLPEGTRVTDGTRVWKVVLCRGNKALEGARSDQLGPDDIDCQYIVIPGLTVVEEEKNYWVLEQGWVERKLTAAQKKLLEDDGVIVSDEPVIKFDEVYASTGVVEEKPKTRVVYDWLVEERCSTPGLTRWLNFGSYSLDDLLRVVNNGRDYTGRYQKIDNSERTVEVAE